MQFIIAKRYILICLRGLHTRPCNALNLLTTFQFQVKEDTSDEDSDTLSMSVNVDFNKLDRKKFNKEFVFVTEDGKTAECFEEIGKLLFRDFTIFLVRPGGMGEATGFS